VIVLAPVSGTLVAMSDVDDPVFAAGYVGPGVAIDPDRDMDPDAGGGCGNGGAVFAPIAGRIAKLHPHAFVTEHADGRGVLVHLGIDTIELRGAGFVLLAAEGDEVLPGQMLIRWNPDAVAASGRSPVCPVIALGAAADAITLLATPGTRLVAGTGLMEWMP
jgi:glucose-specific phosphotransferase system IIA component